jgi:hypothetical protein
VWRWEVGAQVEAGGLAGVVAERVEVGALARAAAGAAWGVLAKVPVCCDSDEKPMLAKGGWCDAVAVLCSPGAACGAAPRGGAILCDQSGWKLKRASGVWVHSTELQ